MDLEDFNVGGKVYWMDVTDEYSHYRSFRRFSAKHWEEFYGSYWVEIEDDQLEEKLESVFQDYITRTGIEV